MTRDDIIRMAREAGFVVDEVAQQYQPNCICHTHYMVDELLERFAALIITAKVAEYQDLLKIQQRRYERQIQIEVENEREACAKLAESTICDTHLPTGVRIYGTRVATAIRASGNT